VFGRWVFFGKFEGPWPSKLQKNGFSILIQNNMAISVSRGARANNS
jgi:hypothetical protein